MMENPEIEDGEFSEVELELIKMTSVSRDIRIVIENILDAKDLDKKVDKELIKTFTIELQSILENIQTFPARARKRDSFKMGDKIAEAQEEEEHSGSFGLQFNNGKMGRESLDGNQLWEVNQQLTEENEFLTAKLEEAEEHIKRIQEEQSSLEEQLSALKTHQSLSTKSSKNDIGYKMNSSEFYQDKEGLIGELMNENEELRQQLQESKDFIFKNNEDFVRQLQKYNQKIWRLERDLEEGNNIIEDYENKLQEYQLITSKLKEENFNLEIAIRNYKSYTNTDRTMRESTHRNQLERKNSLQASKVKNTFSKQAPGTSSYRNILSEKY